MKKLGKTQQLEILRFTSVGAYLNDVDETSDSDVLLPKKYLSDDMALGDLIAVFLYKDNHNRLIATTQSVALEVGQIGQLRVVSQSQFGAFLAWGLDKDLFLPQAEQKGALKIGQLATVIVYVDHSERLCASQKIEKRLTTTHDYKRGQPVSGTVYSLNEQIGAFIAVDNLYYGLLPIKDCFDDLTIGQTITGRIVKIHPDGKLVLSLRAARGEQLQLDVATIIAKLTENGGVLPFDDRAAPSVIKRQLKMSKKAFKRAIGVLLRQKSVIIDSGTIKLLDDSATAN